ncbi:(deoxy)nucleoside triphosphate pyrophosphohydrolase [Rufibacter latericius]|uniref:8-oxo-dGTP diphosphatase n=1 Tax=Rufibacter latericius TaxID=2487040 RepID=A0A3M9MN04_9BACT|nr:(deoxy)nucleoside triphosphate pyrophosphohydrolase [Rufibacter latericius]RNI26920.1 (deoxy)nucleoside triphosphate pyrophosphohydrolase [Rufibacter latericius]
MIDVTCAIILWEDKVLVTQRSEKMSLSLKWEFPGGKIERGETAESCLHRELMEELNIQVKILRTLSPSSFDYGKFSINLIPFLVNYLSGEIILAEHETYKWLSRNELKDIDWAPADVPILEEFLKLNI